MEELKKKLASNEAVKTSSRHYMKIPLSKEHLGHPIGESSLVNQVIDKRIIERIYELVKKNITGVKEVKRCLDEFVEKELFSGAPKHTWPSKTNRRFYPSSKDLRNHISKAIAAGKYCDDDQESLLRKITDLKKSSPSTRFFLRTQEGEPNYFGDNVPTRSNNFLFVHQEEWQRKLLLRYGNDLALLDATYKTTKYAMPLFFLCVNTNVGYKVVAEFMCQHEDEISISEALGILRGWNQDWGPKYFMVDFSAAEIAAIETCFPGVVVYICDFHRQQAIQRWARAGKNGLDHNEQEFLKKSMTRIGRVATEEQYKDELSKLRQSTLYKTKENVRSYVESTWIPCHFRWCHAFRKSQALNIVNTNNGVESMNRLFKYDYLPRSIDKSLYGIVVMIVCSFLPDSYQTYLSANLRLSGSYRKYNVIVPDYLQNRPPNFVKHCLKNKFAAQEIQEKDITCLNDQQGKFLVKSSNKKQSYLVQFSVPSCTCESWRQSNFTCKHFFAIFNFFSKWQFSSLPLAYQDSVFITLDNGGLLINPVTANGNSPSSIKKTEDPPPIPYGTPEGSPPELKAAQSSISPQSPGTLAKLRRQFQDKLDGLKNISFLVEDAKMLQEAINFADNLQVALRSTCPRVDGLLLRGSPEKKKLKITSPDYHKVFHKKLSLRKKRKKIVSATNVNINEDKVKKILENRTTLAHLQYKNYNHAFISLLQQL